MNSLSSLLFNYPKEETKIPSTLRVGNTYITKLTPLGGIFKPGITKAGRLSLTGYLSNGTRIKVYRAHSSKQISLRRIIGDKLKNDVVLLPPVITSDENFIVEKWIEGKSYSRIKKGMLDSNTKNLINFLEKIHHQSEFLDIAKSNKKAFCYLEDYLIIRLSPWKQWTPVEKLINEWINANNTIDKILDSRISHPDLSLSNMIFSNNKTYIIDNELLGVSKGWLLDERNSFFRNKVSTKISDENIKNFYNLSWKLRLVGSALDSGDFARAERMANK